MADNTQEMADRVNSGPLTFVVEVENEEGETGRFQVHRPTVADEIRIGVRYAQLRTPAGKAGEEAPEPLALDGTRDLLAFMLATLSVVVDKRPPWCPKDLGDLPDAQVVIDLYGAFETWRNSFRRRVSGAGAADSGAAESA